MFYVVVISWWAASQSDDRVSVSLEKTLSPEDALSEAKQRLSFMLVKYRIRAEGPNSKDFERERQAIQAALS